MPQPAIDIIIPVYNAYEDLQRCLDSVLRATALRHRVILIDDCSPDSRIADYCETLRCPVVSRLTLLWHEANLSFFGAINRGIAVGQNDVVLLNSYTVVT